MALNSLRGGIEPDAHKKESSETPIRHVPLPSRLVVPLVQSSQESARTIITVGDRVLKGQCIGEAEGAGIAIHAPASGTVAEIGYYPMAHPSGLTSQAIVIEPDGEEHWITYEPLDPATASRDELILRIQASGIVGMGGAVFPSHIKARSKTETLLINGAECEPWITCDDRLMRERASAVVTGSAILAHLTGARQILIGIEDNKPEAIAAMRAAVCDMEPVALKCLDADKITVIAVPTRYPSGGERQLTRILTGIEVPPDKRVTGFGVQCFNVATAYAVCRALLHGESMVSRIVTVTGNVERPGNYETPLGMPIAELIALCGPKPGTTRILMGGPMMGFTLPSLEAPVTKGCNCLIAASAELFPPSEPEQPCIRCGSCVNVCPIELQPFEMYWSSRAKNFDSARQYHLFSCMECGCCAYVCPAHIPLVDYFRFAKSEIRARDEEQKAADQARARFEFRNARLGREKAEKAARMAAKAAETRAKSAGEAALIASAVDRTSAAARTPRDRQS
ncbi:MAG: electron transport complex subunit RsxC [Azoarcus sp.]|jgi:electron transport complex protein RnfC|nr:electron transport complex subunit RsxC [Azoarcus sp.]